MKKKRIRKRAPTISDLNYLGTYRGEIDLPPEKMLRLAILIDALRLYQKGMRSDARSQEFVRAKKWIFEESSRGPFSFVHICQALGLDDSYIRRCARQFPLAVGMNGYLRGSR